MNTDQSLVNQPLYFDARSQGLRDNYRLLIGSVVPRPIAWVSTLSEAGTANLAPYSFFTVASCEPPVLSVVQVNPRGRTEKDTLHNLLATREAVVNLVSEPLAEQMNQSCADLPPDQSEFDFAGLTACESRWVKAPGVAAALVRMECGLRDVIRFGDHPGAGAMMLLDVLGFCVAPEALSDGSIRQDVIAAIGKMGGDAYCTTHTRFDMGRPSSDRPLNV